MNNEQKLLIQELRSQGRTFRQIADATGLSVNTVKSFCHRSDTQRRLCKNCGKALIDTANRKQKTFCCDSCRQAWWKANSDQLHKKATYSLECLNCGLKFESYGNKNRKFCSRGCYFSNRYGVP